MEKEVALDWFTTKRVISLISTEFSHMMSKEDLSTLMDDYIILSTILKRANEKKDPLCFNLNLIYEGLAGVDNTNLLRKYGIALLQEDFPAEESNVTHLHNFFIHCYVCAIKVARNEDESANESVISTLFMRLVNEEKERLGIAEAVDNVFTLCQLMCSGVGIDNASIYVITLLNPLNAVYFQEELIKEMDYSEMTQSSKEFLKYLQPPKDFDQLEELIINVNCFLDYCKQKFKKEDEVLNYLTAHSALDDYQIKILCFYALKDLQKPNHEST